MISSSRSYGESARSRYEEVDSRGEAVLLSGDAAKRQEWLDAMTAAEREVHAARYGPSWSRLLADPFTQPAGVAEVTASILAYKDAPLASACACGGTIHATCGGGRAAESSSSTPSLRDDQGADVTGRATYVDPNVSVARDALALIVARYEAGDTSADEASSSALAALRQALDARCDHEWLHLGDSEDGEDDRYSHCWLCSLNVPGWVPNA